MYAIHYVFTHQHENILGLRKIQLAKNQNTGNSHLHNPTDTHFVPGLSCINIVWYYLYNSIQRHSFVEYIHISQPNKL